MSSLAILQSLKESIVMANVKAVYGEPIAAQGKTVIPGCQDHLRLTVVEGALAALVVPALVAREAVEVEGQERSL
jgi:hypothetical protein